VPQKYVGKYADRLRRRPSEANPRNVDGRRRRGEGYAVLLAFVVLWGGLLVLVLR
jgi:hypothetical protein